MGYDEDLILETLRRYVVPALGCTEPVAVALAAARAARILETEPDRIMVTLDRDMLRNAFAVGIPGTGERGVKIAAALGAFGGDPDRGLMVISDVPEAARKKASRFVEHTGVEVMLDTDADDIHILVELFSGDHSASVLVEGAHERVTRMTRDGGVVFTKDADDGGVEKWVSYFSTLDIGDARSFIDNVNLDDIAFMEEGLTLTLAAAKVGIGETVGLGYGSDLDALVHPGFSIQNIVARARVEAAAASGARMAGFLVPVMSSFGSGNQGIVVNAVVGAVARQAGYLDTAWLSGKKDENPGTVDTGGPSIIPEEHRERLLRTLALAHLVVGLAKSHTGMLSPYCEAAVTTAGAASAASVYLLGGDMPRMENAFLLTVAATEGVFCDGAKESCALKTAMGAGAAVENAYLSLYYNAASRSMGVVGKNFAHTMRNFGRLAKNTGLGDIILKLLMEEDVYLDT
ncbi:MAG: serine dehydratase subunit alpha family protein [Deltaproteobacteria bacterium]|nr:serine dehydratase subunit alpha family protein [Candidatus Zymogenaceae bacterium]